MFSPRNRGSIRELEGRARPATKAPEGRQRVARGASPWRVDSRTRSPGGATAVQFAELLSPLRGFGSTCVRFPGARAPGYALPPLPGLSSGRRVGDSLGAQSMSGGVRSPRGVRDSASPLVAAQRATVVRKRRAGRQARSLATVGATRASERRGMNVCHGWLAQQWHTAKSQKKLLRARHAGGRISKTKRQLYRERFPAELSAKSWQIGVANGMV
jgi:hypothetical protein